MHSTDRVTFDEFSTFVELISKKASEIARSKFNENFNKWNKEDGTIVTEVDVEIEKFIRSEIYNKYPNHSLHGEEEEDVNNNSSYRWIIDPIDGTLSFSSGIPFYGILIGLCFQNEIIYGSYRLPSHNDFFVSSDGESCISNHELPRVAKVHGNSDNLLFLTTDVDRVENSRFSSQWKKLKKIKSTTRTWGDCFGYHMVITRNADLMMDLDLKKCDILPLIPIISGTGLKMRRLTSNSYKDLVVYNPKLEKTINNIFG
jgi:fructose-1,6-bisphosphatase/inositol monophosphatase family enzyme